jgi:DNA-binding SARP family transcriptional activator
LWIFLKMALSPCCYLAVSVIRVHLTSRIAVRGPAGQVVGADLPGELGRLLLTRLVLRRYPVARSQLLEDLWCGAPPPAAESVLNATISRLRRSFDRVGVEGRSVLVASGGLVELRRPHGTWVDVEAAHRAVDAAEGHLRRGEPKMAWAEAVVASAIARRPLLPGFEREWLDLEQDRLSRALERSLSVLTDAWLALGDSSQATSMARELVRVAPLAESSHRRLVLALLAAGDRAAASQAVAAWDRVLTDELGLPPDGCLRVLLRGDGTIGFSADQP